MNNKIKQIFTLLFVVATLLLMIGSVSAANAVELDENLEASIVVDDDASIDDDGFIPNLDDKVSSQTTNDDEAINDNLNDINSKVVVSSEEQTTIGAKDSKGTETEILGNYYFSISKKPLSPYAKVGDIVDFEIIVQNVGDYRFRDGYIQVQEWFDETELEYLGYTPSSYEWLYSNTTFDDQYGKRPVIQYSCWGYDWNPSYTINFTVHFRALKEGNLTNRAQIWWQEWWGGPTHEVWAESTILVGHPELTIIKTPHQEEYCLGDDVYFDVFIKNTGTLPVTTTVWWDPYNPSNEYMWIDDWYDLDGLKFVDITINPDENGKVYTGNYWYADEFDGVYGHQLLVQYATQGHWEPGYSLNFTTHFIANKTGVLNNSAHIFWKWKYWGDADIHEHIEVWGNASVRVGEANFTLVKTSNNDTVNVGDMVSFTINYTNTGSVNLTGVYIKDNEYTNGLVFSDYSDKDLWTFDGTDTWYYNSELAPGESAILELTFQATTAGEKNNTAIAGHNLTDETLNSTDTVLVVEDEPDTPEEEPEEEPEKEPEEEPSTPVAEKAVPAIPAAGNPVFVLIMSLVLLCFVPLRGKK